MPAENYHTPTGLERAFLRVVTTGYPELQRQVEACEVDDYDEDGYCDVHVLVGPPSPIVSGQADGPRLVPSTPSEPFAEIILWTDERGMLSTVEIVDFGSGLATPYQAFTAAAESTPPALEYQNARQDR